MKEYNKVKSNYRGNHTKRIIKLRKLKEKIKRVYKSLKNNISQKNILKK